MSTFDPRTPLTLAEAQRFRRGHKAKLAAAVLLGIAGLLLNGWLWWWLCGKTVSGGSPVEPKDGPGPASIVGER